jgi:hypothetical protein
MTHLVIGPTNPVMAALLSVLIPGSCGVHLSSAVWSAASLNVERPPVGHR